MGKRKVICGVQQVGIGVRNVEESWAWYKDVFGFDIKLFGDVGVAERQMQEYRDEIDAMDQDIKELETNRDTLEKFAREQFGFAVPGEDVYIVE